MSDGVDRKRIRRHLLIFSLAAPLMAIFTCVLLKSVCLLLIIQKTNVYLDFFREFVTRILLILLGLRCYLVRAHFYLSLQFTFYPKYNLIMMIVSFALLIFLFLLLDVVFL
jgi:hypothetical protein